MIKAEWTNADALDLQPTCNQLATDTISRQAATDALMEQFKRNTPITVHPVGEVKEIFISEPTQEIDFPNINLQSETISMSLTLRRRDKKTWGRIFQMPKYKVTEWMFPKKKKRGSKRRKRKENQWIRSGL